MDGIFPPETALKPELQELAVSAESITILRAIGNGNFSNVMEASVVGLQGVEIFTIVVGFN
jgi:hypothetical protein